MAATAAGSTRFFESVRAVEKHIDQMASPPQTNRVDDHLGITSGRYLGMKDETPTANLFVPNADLASSHRVNATRPLAKISARTGRQVVWDRVANDIDGNKEASEMLQRPDRAAWGAEIKALLS